MNVAVYIAKSHSYHTEIKIENIVAVNVMWQRDSERKEYMIVYK